MWKGRRSEGVKGEKEGMELGMEREGKRKELELEVECLGSGNSMVVAIRSQCPSGSEYGRSVSSQNPERGIVNS